MLAVANLLWFVFAGIGALTLGSAMVPAGAEWAARLTPSGALTEALTHAMTLSVDWFGIAVLIGVGRVRCRRCAAVVPLHLTCAPPGAPVTAPRGAPKPHSLS